MSVVEFPTATPRPATITAQRALQDGITAASIRAVADWNESESRNPRRRKDVSRLEDQAASLRAVANEVEAHNGSQLHRQAA